MLVEFDELEELMLDCVFFLRRLGWARAAQLPSLSSLLLLAAALEDRPGPTDVWRSVRLRFSGAGCAAARALLVAALLAGFAEILAGPAVLLIGSALLRAGREAVALEAPERFGTVPIDIKGAESAISAVLRRSSAPTSEQSNFVTNQGT